MKTDCDEIFSDFLTKYCEERTSFYNLHEQVQLKTKLKFEKEVAKLELQIKKDPSILVYDLKKANLNNYVKTLTQNVPDSKWKNYFISWYSKELDDFMKDVHAMIVAIRLYRDKFKTFFNENVCVHENKFHEAHSIFAKLVEGDNNHTWKNSRLKVLSGIGIELTRQSFNQLNLDIINKEEEMAKQASVYAEERYNVLMKSKISERTFTDSEVKTLHQMNVKAVVDSFHAVPQFKYTYVRERYLNELGIRLHIHLSNYLKENQQNVDRVQRTKKNLMSECINAYNDSMNKLIADRIISDKKLRSHHDRSFEEVLQILNVRMNSIPEKFDKSSWAKELPEKLRIYFNGFAEENNRKMENEVKNHQPAAVASIGYANAGSTQSCGVGIYFGPDIVRLGIYSNPQTSPKYLNFSPFITFEGNEIVFFNRHSIHHDHFDVYKTLVEAENSRRTVFVSGKFYKLWTEEIVAVLLNKIKSEAETKYGFVITSCTVAVSAFMSTSSKHMLKTALTMAGFERSTIIQSTTAVGLSYVVANKVYGNVPAAFIHQAGSVFDVAIAVINQTSVSIRRISGLPYLEKSSGYFSKVWSTPDSQDALDKKVKKLISSTIAPSEFPAWQLKVRVMVEGEETFISDRSAITATLLCRSLNTLDETQGIVFGAAAFNAFQCKIPGAPNLEYNEVFPYTLIADIYGEKTAKIVRHNITMPVASKNMRTRFAFTDVRDSRTVRITEFAAEKEKIFVGEYTVNAVKSDCRNVFVFVSVNYEGLIEVEAKIAVNSSTVPVEIRIEGLTMAQQCTAMKNLRPILIPTVAPCLPNVPIKSNEVKTNTGALEKGMTSPVVVAHDLKSKLADLIADMKDQLKKSTMTNPMILSRINERIKECEELLGKDDLNDMLRVYVNALLEENNRLLNEARHHQPEAAASVDYGKVTSTQFFGVGIYFGPDIVRLGIYLNAQTNPKYLKFSPFVTFERNEIVFFNRHSSHHLHFDVYKTLVEEENFPRTVLISDKVYQLHTEEIVALFLNKIKSEAETKFGFAISSCTVAVSAFMSTSSKQMLKTALTLAGFERSTIIHSTTAVGLSFVVTSRVCPNGPAIFVYQAGSVFDVAIAVINQTSISIRRISGLPYLEKSAGYLSAFLDTTDSQDALNKKVKKLISNTVASSEFTAWQLEALVMVQGKKHFLSDKSAITEPLLGRPLTTLDETEGIVLGAAAFNAFENKIPGASYLEYNEVFPYTFMAEVNGKPIKKFARHNMRVISDNLANPVLLTYVTNWMQIRITESAGEKEKIFVGEYTIDAKNSKSRNISVFVNFNYEGLIEIAAQTTDLETFPVHIRTKGLTLAQQCAAWENLRQILIPASAPCLPNVPVKNEEGKTNAGAVENEMTSPVPVAQDPKTKLADLIREVKDRLAQSKATNPMIVTQINERIKACEELLGKDDVNEMLWVYFNAFTDENNRLQNDFRNHQSEAAASADYGTVTNTQSFGVGIYFGPDIVRLGIYTNPQTNPKYLEFSPFVTFERNEIVFFNQHSSHHHHFNVYKTLVQEENFPRTVLISDKAYQFHTEEVVAVFLNKIKSEAETKFGFVITSCTIAVSAFMNTSSKQMLKTALTLAGFERSTIIHSTTAVGLSFVVTSKVCPNGPVIFVHQAGSVFDVAIAVIHQTSLSIRRVSGEPYLEKSSGHLSAFLDTTDVQDALSKKVKKLINSTLASSEFTAWQLEALVMVHGEKHFISDKSAITEPLLGRPLTTLDETEGIVLGAAAFNAFQNKIPGAPNLEYNEVFPYTFMADINGKQTAKIVRHNVPLISKNMSTQLPVTDVRDFGEVRITEFAVEKEKIIVGEYTINAMNSKCRNFLLHVKFNSEGLIEVEAQTADLKTFPVQIRTQGLTAAEQSAAVKNVRPILIPIASSCLLPIVYF